MPDGNEEPPRHPEAPSTSEIQAATESAVNAARLERQNLERASLYAPRGARATPEGERVAPFQGFGLSIATVPPGASVRVDGNDVGETPIVTTVDCEPGEDVEVLVAKAGFRQTTRHVRCRADSLLELSVALARPTKAPP